MSLDQPPTYTQDLGGGHDSGSNNTSITSTISGAIRHLQSISGSNQSLFRGLACATCYQIAFTTTGALLAYLLRLMTLGFIMDPVDKIIGSLVATFILIHWQTAWTHIVISGPSREGWLRRVPPLRRTVKNTWLATAVHELASRLTLLTIAGMAIAMGLLNPSQHKSASVLLGKLSAILLVALVLTIVFVIPSGVVLKRVQASMLPEQDETIVPFDRTFDGCVEPSIVGGSGVIGFVDAWKTFNRSAWRRVVRLCARIVMVEVVLHLAFGVLLGAEYALFRKKTLSN